MTTANKHMARSRRSYNNTKAILGSVEQRNYLSRTSKAKTTEKLRVFKPIATRLNNLKNKLSANVTDMFRKQDR